MLRRMRDILLLCLAACMLLVCAAGAAESIHEEVENPAFDMEVTVGYDGMMTYGKVMPVRVRIRNYGDDFEGILAMNAHMNAREYDRYEKAVAIPAGSQREFELYLTVYARQNAFTAELVKDGEVICAANGKPRTVINPSAMLIGVLSTRPQNLKNLDINRDNDTLARYEYWNTIPLTKEVFPEEEEALESFGMLVVDDFDPAGLSEKQQAALDKWLRAGRVLLCGGGANAGRNTAYFSEYTGLALEGITSSDSVVASLERLISRKESGRQVTAALAQYSGAEALGSDTAGNGLIWRTTVGSGRIYTAAFELGDMALNSENLMHYFWQQLLVDQEQDFYYTLLNNYGKSYSNTGVNVDSYIPVRADSRMLPGVLAVAGMLVLACILWWFLKKKDLRQWMWLALPALSILAVAGVLLLAGGAETNRPLAVIADNLIQDSSGVISRYSGISVAVPSYGRHSYSLEGETLETQIYDYVDYDEESEEKQEPVTLRTCYTVDGLKNLSVESLQPWDTVRLTAESTADIQGKIDGVIWMEEDGLHGEIVNGTDLKMSAGNVITNYGFASVPALAPGEKAGFSLKKSAFADPKDPSFNDGFMYPESTVGFYGVMQSAVDRPNEGVKQYYPGMPDEEGALKEMISNASDRIGQKQGGQVYGAYEALLFVYCAKPEGMKPQDLRVDGAPVEKQAAIAMLTTELSYQAVGRTGVVFRSAGMDIPEYVGTSSNLMPATVAPKNAKTMYYFQLSDNPTFLFTLNELAGVRVESLQVVENSYYVNQAKAYALNAEKQEWEEIPINADIKNPERYLDEEGRLYIQFRLDGQEMYADIAMPMINLEGRLEHAEN